jgi:predicted NBD/HSP70 family sugar kinase
VTAPRPATPPLLKRLNEEAVLETIRAGKPISRAEISRRAGISKPTVSLALQALLDAGLVREAAEGPRGPRYGATYFEPVDEAALVLGVDVGARFLRGALCDLSGTIRARRDDALARADADEVLPAIVRMRDRLVAASGLDAGLIDAVVVGLPGVVEADSGEIRLASNVSRLEGRRFGAELEALLGQPVTVENDVNLAALGEGRDGVARGASNFFVLSVGTGLGGGLVLGGELQRGQHGAAGEMDFARAGVEQELDPSAEGLSALAAQRAAEADTVLVAPYDPRAVFAAARAGDAVARAVVAEEAVRIARHIVAIAAVADVALVVLGGGIGANPELLDGIRARLAEWLYYPPRVELSSLGDGAVLAGALAVGLRSALDSVLVRRRAG